VSMPWFDYQETGEDDVYFLTRGSVTRESDTRSSLGGFPEPDIYWGTLTAQPGPDASDPWRGHDEFSVKAPMRRWRLPFPPLRIETPGGIILREWPRPPLTSPDAPDFESEALSIAFLALRWRHYLLWRVERSRRHRTRGRQC
jgi:hypothetical protein